MNASAARELSRLLGEGNVHTGPRALAPYFSKPVPSARLTLVTPSDTQQLSDVAAFSYENGIPLYSARRALVEDESLPGREGILVDLKKMNEIKKVDARNLVAHVYAGVTFEQLAAELAKENQRILYPAAGMSPYVLRSYVDRDILLGSSGYRHHQYSVFHAMMADGQVWVSGSQQATDEGHADFREDQGPQFSQFFGASEDIFGIPFYGLVYTYPNREERRVLAVGFAELEPALELLYLAAHEEWCFEAFAADSRYLSTLLAAEDGESAAAVRKKLNPWTVVFAIEQYRDLVELWDGYMRKEAKDRGGKVLRGKVPELAASALEKPWLLHERGGRRGGCRHVFCYESFRNVAGTFGLVDEQVSSAGVRPADIGRVVIPTYFGGAAYCEADILFDPSDEAAAGAAEAARLKSFETLLENGAFVDRPTGPVAEMVFSRTDPSYVDVIKLFKKTVDPRGLLNPGQLLEGV